MKKKFLIAAVFAFFLLLLCFPQEALEGSSNGLLLWFHTVLPTLLPFIILTNFILKLDAVHILCRFAEPVCRRLFSIGTYGCYALITGLLCGYPMGAKITADLIRENRLSTEEGNYLLGICNNASPMFLVGYVITQSLQCPEHKTALLLIVYGTPLLYAICTKPNRHSAQIIQNSLQAPANKKNGLTFRIIDESIMNGFETITRLGGYIILFAIIAKMATVRLHTVTILNHFLIGFIEITNGVHSIGSSALDIKWKIPLAVSIVTFGGLSGLAQTKSMIQGTSLSIRRYLLTKLKLAGISLLLSALYCQLFIA